MRYLLCGVAAVALSGCSWMGIGHKHKSHQSHDYAYTKASDDCCVGGKTLSRWNIEGGVGQEFTVGGKALTGDEAHAGFAANTFNNVSMDTAYDGTMRYDLGGSYAINPNRKVTGQVFYKNADGNDVLLGTQNGNALRGAFTDYESYGAELGLRQYMRPVGMPLLKSVRPYVEGKLGAAYIDDIGLTNVREAGVAGASNIAMYEGGIVPTAAGLVGVETPVFNRFTMGVESGIRYTGKLGSDGTNITNGFEQFGGTNNGSSTWSVPVTLRGRYRF